MSGMLIRAALRKSLGHIRHISPVPPPDARGLVAEVYAQVERDFGLLAPPVALHSPAPEPLAACWLLLRETLVAAGMVDRTSKELIATEVSFGNSCPYCVMVHSTTLDTLDHGERDGPVADWVRASATPASAARHGTPFPDEQVPEMVGVLVAFHYLNRMVNVFLPETPLPPGMPAAARGGAMGLFGRFMGAAARRATEPGTSLDLLPAAPLPADVGWAAGNPTVAGAFARACAAFEAAGTRSVPEGVRDLVTGELAGWHGLPFGPSRAWVHEAVAELPEAQRPAGRLALLTALASYQVDESAIDDFRRETPDDSALVDLTSWASMAAARRVGSWNRFPGKAARSKKTTAAARGSMNS
jgi:AhpD family alkylhydroperoxidase